MNRWLGCLVLAIIYPTRVLSQQSTVSDIEKQIPHAFKIVEFLLDQGKSQ